MGYWTDPVFSRRTPARRKPARRSTSGWLAWWAAPVGSTTAPRRSNTRTNTRTRTGTNTRTPAPRSAGWLDWWRASPGSRPCPVCGRHTNCRCRTGGQAIPRPRRRNGTPPRQHPPDFRARGAVWCGACRHRIGNRGVCSNPRCATRTP